MAQFTQLRDHYAFPGFRPAAHIHGIFGDPYAVIIPLRRLRKKPPAECVEPTIAPSMIKTFAGFAIWIAAGVVSTWRFPSGVSSAACARP
jgi:hypothetical protein